MMLEIAAVQLLEMLLLLLYMMLEISRDFKYPYCCCILMLLKAVLQLLEMLFLLLYMILEIAIVH